MHIGRGDDVAAGHGGGGRSIKTRGKDTTSVDITPRRDALSFALASSR